MVMRIPRTRYHVPEVKRPGTYIIIMYGQDQCPEKDITRRNDSAVEYDTRSRVPECVSCAGRHLCPMYNNNIYSEKTKMSLRP